MSASIIRLEHARSRRDATVQARNDLLVAESLIACVNDGSLDPIDARDRIYDSWQRRHYALASSGGVERHVAL